MDVASVDAIADEEAQTHSALIAPADRQSVSMQGQASVYAPPQRFHVLYALHAATLLLLFLLFVVLWMRPTLPLDSDSDSILPAAATVHSAAPSSTAAGPPLLLPSVLPSPPASFGGFLLLTNFGRESNRYLLMLYAVRWALFTDRRVVLAPYDTQHSTPLSFMYNIDEMDKQMRQARAVLGRPALEMDQALAHIISWAEYQQLALGLSASSIEARTPVPPDARHPGHCFALERVVCARVAECLSSIRDECVEGMCPLDTRAVSRVPLPATLSALRALTDADPFLVLTGDTVWYTPIWRLLNASEPDQRVSPQQREVIEGMGPALHPIIMQRAHAILEDIRANHTAHLEHTRTGQDRGKEQATATATAPAPALAVSVAVPVPVPVPVVLLHIRLGDFVSGDRASSLPDRLSGLVAAASSLGLTDLNRTTTSTCVVIATDSTSAQEKAMMRRAFPSAIIGLPDSQREADRIALAFSSRSQLSPHESRVLFPSSPPVFRVLLDKAVCILADYFIGTQGSTYSKVIQALRTKSGKNKNTQALVK